MSDIVYNPQYGNYQFGANKTVSNGGTIVEDKSKSGVKADWTVVFSSAMNMLGNVFGNGNGNNTQYQNNPVQNGQPFNPNQDPFNPNASNLPLGLQSTHLIYGVVAIIVGFILVTMLKK